MAESEREPMGVWRVAEVLLTCADVCWQVEGGASAQLSYKEVAGAHAELKRPTIDAV